MFLGVQSTKKTFLKDKMQVDEIANVVLVVGTDLLVAMFAIIGTQVLLVNFTMQMSDVPTLDIKQLTIFGSVLVFTKCIVRLYQYRQKDPYAITNALTRLLIAVSVSFFFLIALYLVAPGTGPFPVIIGTSLGAFCLIELFLFYRFPLLYNVAGLSQKALVFGSGPMAERIASLMARTDNFYSFYGYVTPESGMLSIQNGHKIDTCEHLYEIVQKNNIKKIVVTIKERREHLPVRDLFSCKLRGVEVIDAVTFYERVTGKLLLEEINPSWFIFDKGFCVTRLWFIKQRVVDILTSFVGIVLTLPLFPLLALAIKLDSKGPVLFRQPRVGFKEKHFNVIKLRTMCVNAEQQTGAVWAQENDSRVTTVGRFLRKSRLDEIPQLFNVLKGEMSFVGPRPERPEFVEQLNKRLPYYSKRHSVRPGLTGWAQVNYPYGASEADALEKLRYDLYFIKNFSLRLEVLIILKTIKVVLFGKGGR